MLRIATKEDLPLVLEMGMKFAASTKYKDYVEEDKVKTFILKLFELPLNEAIIILYEDKGMLGGSKTPLMFGSVPIATELAWWVEPEARKQGVGDALVNAFELWAKESGCVLVSLSFLDIDLSNYMKTKGYERYESAHIKVL